MEHKSPSILRILRTDYLAALSVLFPLIFWGLWAYDAFLSKNARSIPWFPVAVGITLIGFMSALWRIRLIGSAFEDGQEVEGTISDVGFFRDRGRVTYVYSINGERYQVNNAVMLTRQSRQLRPGQNVVIMANPDQPRTAFIRDLYS